MPCFKKIVFFILIFSFNQEFSFCQPKKFKLNGKIHGNNLKFIIIDYYSSINTYIKDTIILKKGKFRYKGSLSYPVLAGFSGSKGEPNIEYQNFSQIFIEPKKMKIVAEEGDFKDLKMYGSKMQRLSNELQKKTQPIYDELDSLDKIFSEINDKNITNPNQYNQIKIKYTDIKDSLKSELSDIEYVFIQKNPTSFIAPYLLLRHFPERQYDSLRKIYSEWPKRIKNSIYGVNIDKELNKMKFSALLTKAPDFILQTIAGETVKLSAFVSKKNVLLDFWASWCVPCRESFPFLKNITADTSIKDLIIIPISTDEKEDLWRKACKFRPC